VGGAPAPVSDRRGEGFAGVAGDLLTSGEPTAVAVADVARRREGLEAVVAGLAQGALPVVEWGSLETDRGLLEGFAHLVALDPPPLAARDPLLGLGPHVHLAWGPAEAEFALCVWRDELDLRPALAEVYRALRELAPDAGPDALEAALGGARTHPRRPEACARLLAVLSELGLADVRLEERSCRVAEEGRVDLERSPTYRRARERLAAITAALAAELPGSLGARAA
jgi:single-stranded-DNA-specific exonuclease